MITRFDHGAQYRKTAGFAQDKIFSEEETRQSGVHRGFLRRSRMTPTHIAESATLNAGQW
jgi:hypothetical protein